MRPFYPLGLINSKLITTDAAIDTLEYGLYALTAGEIELIENATSEPRAEIAKASN